MGPPVDIDRRILVLDSPAGELQRLALDLMGSEFGVHYANDIDEAQLMARDAGGSIVAVLFSTAIPLERVSTMAARFGVKPAGLVPTGPRPANRVVAALAFHGVRWHLWDDPSDEAIRFVLSSVLFERDPFELRYHLRVPTNLPARLAFADGKSEATIRDIGLGGVCLLGGALGAIGEEGSVCFEVDGRAITLGCRVAWKVGDAGATCVGGVAFLEVDPEAGEAIDSIRKGFIARQRIEKPTGDKPKDVAARPAATSDQSDASA
ncbi:MAG: PilZ domain-containing protein [Holophagales bacterium]|nr:PilZ domain-containing protein [Holophagales bacterium]